MAGWVYSKPVGVRQEKKMTIPNSGAKYNSEKAKQHPFRLCSSLNVPVARRPAPKVYQVEFRASRD